MKHPQPGLSRPAPPPLASSRPFAAFHGLAQFAMFSGVDEGKDFRDRRVCARKTPDPVQALGEHPRTVKQLLIKRPYHGEALAGELAAFHADDVEAGERRVLAARKRKRDHVAAYA